MSAWMSCTSSSLGLSVYVLAATLVAQLVLGVALAWILARKRFPGHGLLDSLVSLPLVFPPIVIGYLLLLALGRQGWLANATGWSPNIVFQPSALLIAAFIAGLPLMVKPVQNSMNSLSPRLREAAATLGHGTWSYFFRVELPLLRPALATGLILSGGRAMGEVGISLMLGGNIAGRTETLSLSIYNAVLDGDTDCANALSCLLGLTALACFWALRRYGNQK
ncbi:molybdate ABC transporter permease subunit [Alcaligenes nematophilus]|uniref:molybdate ABC transporter permease subunit n=1 Tax=Alcaligenes nematophilus TaxID=2994643 RepID=UPI00384BB912